MSQSNSITEKTRINVPLAVLWSLLCLVAIGTFYVASFASDTNHEIKALQSDKLEADTFYDYKKTQEYNQRELFRKVTVVNNKIDKLLKKEKIKFEADSLEFNGD
ncbi:MAG: hypothetical protein IT280_13110 [Ignavibacteria bacterium]|nr:hypothetical protein [Ignavibacteria bacterium]